MISGKIWTDEPGLTPEMVKRKCLDCEKPGVQVNTANTQHIDGTTGLVWFSYCADHVKEPVKRTRVKVTISFGVLQAWVLERLKNRELFGLAATAEEAIDLTEAVKDGEIVGVSMDEAQTHLKIIFSAPL